VPIWIARSSILRKPYLYGRRSPSGRGGPPAPVAAAAAAAAFTPGSPNLNSGITVYGGCRYIGFTLGAREGKRTRPLGPRRRSAEAAETLLRVGGWV
jgi:hypothetical protein